MRTTDARSTDAIAQVGTFDMKVEVVVVPVSDVDTAKEFYQRLGWRVDVTPPGVVQFTPPGSWRSVQFGPALSTAAPGSAKAYLVISDIVAARNAIIAAGVEVDEIFHTGPDGPSSGPDPEHRTNRSRADGNIWLLQEVTARLPGRRHVVQRGQRPERRAAARCERARRARAAHRREGRELARLVRHLHGRRASRHRVADLSTDTLFERSTT